MRMLKRTPLIAVIAGVILVVGFLVYAAVHTTYSPNASARMAGNYLVSVTKDDGTFHYSIDPLSGTASTAYNILRHAGTTYSMLEWYEYDRDPAVLDAAKRALAFLAEQVHPCPAPFDGACVVEKNEVKLGGNGLAVLAFAKYQSVTGDTTYEATARSLAKYITGTQTPEGEFAAHKIQFDTGSIDDFNSSYYPGEALFALARLSEVTGDRSYIDAAHLGAHWIIEVRDTGKGVGEIEHDHWFLYALNELYTDRADTEYLTHTRLIVDAIVQTQHQNMSGDTADWNGGYYNPPRSTPTATRSEGLAASIALFRQASDNAYEKKATDALRRGIVFQQKTQMTPDKVEKLNAHPLSLGGFSESLDEYEIRIDYVQHNLSALIAYIKLRE